MDPTNLHMLHAARQDPTCLELLADKLAESGDARAILEVLQEARWMFGRLENRRLWDLCFEVDAYLPRGMQWIQNALHSIAIVFGTSELHTEQMTVGSMCGLSRQQIEAKCNTKTGLFPVTSEQLNHLESWLAAHGLALRKEEPLNIEPVPPSARELESEALQRGLEGAYRQMLRGEIPPACHFLGTAPSPVSRFIVGEQVRDPNGMVGVILTDGYQLSQRYLNCIELRYRVGYPNTETHREWGVDDLQPVNGAQS